MALVAALDVADALDRFADGRVVSARGAHGKLAEWRSNHTVAPGQNPAFPRHMFGYSREYEDITDGDWDWRGYVSNRMPGAVKHIVGEGVLRIELRFLAAIDYNMTQNRVDFVLFRVDGSGVRLHPSRKRDAKPVFARNPAVWFIGGETEVGPPYVPEVLLHSYLVVRQHDKAFRKDAAAFLLHEELAASESGWPGGFTRDITDQQAFPWMSYFASLPHGTAMLQRGVRKVQVVWQGLSHQRPAFYLETADGSCYLHSPVARKTWDADAVWSIYWSS